MRSAALVNLGSSVAFAARTTSGRLEKQRLSLRDPRTGKLRTLLPFAANAKNRTRRGWHQHGGGMRAFAASASNECGDAGSRHSADIVTTRYSALPQPRLNWEHGNTLPKWFPGKGDRFIFCRPGSAATKTTVRDALGLNKKVCLIAGLRGLSSHIRRAPC